MSVEKPTLDDTIDVLELSVRARNGLINNSGWSDNPRSPTIRWVLSQSDAELLRTPNFGKKSLRELKAELEKHWHWGREQPQPILTIEERIAVALERIANALDQKRIDETLALDQKG
jgi:DNA-directed RNA polymerase alpha subunit